MKPNPGMIIFDPLPYSRLLLSFVAGCACVAAQGGIRKGTKNGFQYIGINGVDTSSKGLINVWRFS